MVEEASQPLANSSVQSNLATSTTPLTVQSTLSVFSVKHFTNNAQVAYTFPLTTKRATGHEILDVKEVSDTDVLLVPEYLLLPLIIWPSPVKLVTRAR